MLNSINNIVLRHLNGIYIQKDKLNNDNEEVLTIAEFMTIVKKFEGFGYTFDKNAVSIISNLERSYAIDLCKEMLENIESMKSDKDYVVFYKNFPEEVINMDEADIYFNQILHYWFGYIPEEENFEIGKETIKENETEKTTSKEDFVLEPSQLVALSHLKIVTDEDIEKLFADLLSSNITLSKQYLNDVCFLSEGFSDEEIQEYAKNIKMKETLTVLAKYILKNRNILVGDFNTATDVLRLIAKMSGGELDTKYIHFGYFNRTTLAILMQKLNSIPYILADIKRYKKPWHRFFKFYAKKINFNKYPNVKKAVDMLFGEIKFESQQAYFEKNRKNIPNMTNDELIEFTEKFSKYSGDYVRNILSLLNIANKKQYHILINGLKNAMPNVNTRILFQLYDRILNLLEKTELTSEKEIIEKEAEEMVSNENKLNKIAKTFRNVIFQQKDKNEEIKKESYNIKLQELQKKYIPRVVNSKGIWRKLDETIFLEKEFLQYILTVIEKGIFEQLKLREPLGNVYIDKSYEKITMTTSEKDSNVSIRPMTRGSKVSFNENTEVLRFFVGWKNIERKEKNNILQSRVDVDLSAICFDKDFMYVDVIAYHNQKKEGFAFSGDIVDAPDGALEYIDVYDLDKVKKDNIRYILMTIRDFNGHTFKEIGNVYAGVMELTEKESRNDQNMYSSAITQGFHISSDTLTTNTILVDLEKNEYVWIDMNLPTLIEYSNANRINDTEKAELEDMLKFLLEKKYISMYKLLEMNVEARGTRVFDKESADVIFEEVNSDNILPLPDISANYF